MSFRTSFLKGLGQGVGSLIIWGPVVALVWFAMGTPSPTDVAEAFGRGFAAIITACENHLT